MPTWRSGGRGTSRRTGPARPSWTASSPTSQTASVRWPSRSPPTFRRRPARFSPACVSRPISLGRTSRRVASSPPTRSSLRRRSSRAWTRLRWRDRHARAPGCVRRTAPGRARACPGGRRHEGDRDRLGDRVVSVRPRPRRARAGCRVCDRHPSAPGGRRRGRSPDGAGGAPRRRPRGRGRRDRARLLPGLCPARPSVERVPGSARARGGALAPRRRPHASSNRADALGARHVRRHGRPPLLLRARAPAGRGRARLLPLLRRQRHLPQGCRASRGGCARPGESYPRRDRRSLPRAAACPRAAVRAGPCPAHARGARRCARRAGSRSRGPHRGERRRRLLPVVTAHRQSPRKELGQHFLVDENVLAVVGRLAVLTVYLADRVSHVTAVEIDRSLEPRLLEALAGRGNVDLVFADALALDLSTLVPPPSKLVSNLPYSVATPIVADSLDGLPSVTRWCVMVQREVAERFFAPPGTRAYGSVSVLLQLATERVGFHPVARGVFRPRPNVDSALVAFRRLGPLPHGFAEVRRVVQAVFAHRRKTLANSLELAGLASRERAAAALADL